MSFRAIWNKDGVSISNCFPEVHKRGIYTHTDRHTHTHNTHTHNDSIRRNAMRCISSKNQPAFEMMDSYELIIIIIMIIYKHFFYEF